MKRIKIYKYMCTYIRTHTHTRMNFKAVDGVHMHPVPLGLWLHAFLYSLDVKVTSDVVLCLNPVTSKESPGDACSWLPSGLLVFEHDLPDWWGRWNKQSLRDWRNLGVHCPELLSPFGMSLNTKLDPGCFFGSAGGTMISSRMLLRSWESSREMSTLWN